MTILNIEFISNIENDSKKAFRSFLNEQGVRISDADTSNVGIQYFQFFERVISPRPRNVYISRELSDSKETLDEDIKEGLEQLIKSIEKGDPLQPYQSKSILKGGVNDGIFSHWDIHHLHLGLTLEDDEFMSRTGLLLYLIVHTDVTYLLDVREHYEWENKDFLNIAYKNWPEIYEKSDINMVNPTLSNNKEYIKKLRKNDINAVFFVTDCGSVILPTGLKLGVTTAGNSLTSRLNFQEYYRYMKESEKRFENKIRDMISTQTDIPEEITKVEVRLEYTVDFDMKNLLNPVINCNILDCNYS